MAVKVDARAPVARLRTKNQITLPESIAIEAGVSVGDRFRVTVENGVIKLRRLRTSYAGLFPDLWPDNWMDELRQEREEWSVREEW